MNAYITYPAGVRCTRCRENYVYPDLDPVCGECRIKQIGAAFIEDLRKGLDQAFESAGRAPESEEGGDEG